MSDLLFRIRGSDETKPAFDSAGRNADAFAVRANNSGRSAARGMQAANSSVANLAAQFNDIGVSLAGGQSPFVIALQQGTQISQVLGQGGAAGAVSMLGGALASIVSPISLATIGIIALGGSALEYFLGSEDGASKASTAIEEHGEIIRAVKEAYGDAAAGLGEYVLRSQTELAAAARANLSTLKDIASEARQDFIDSFLPDGSLFGRLAVAEEFRPFQAAIEAFRDSVRAGQPDFVTLRNEIERIAASNPEGLRETADEIITMASAANDAERRVRQAEDAISVIGGAALGQVDGVSQLKNALNELANIAVPALSDADRALNAYREAIASASGREDRAAAQSAYDAAQERLSNTGEGAAADIGVSEIPIPGRRPLLELGDSSLMRRSGGGSGRSAAAREAEREAEQYQRLIQTLEDERDMIGATRTEQRTLQLQRRANVDAASAEGQAIANLVAQIDEQKTAYSEATKASEFMRDNLQQAFADLVPEIETGNKALDGFINRLMQASAESLLFGSGPLGGLFGGAGGIIGSIFGGGRAIGGPVEPFQNYLVGENGPEIVRIGARGGVVSPNQGAAGGSGGGGAVKLDIGIAFDQDDGFRGYVKSVSQSTAEETSRNQINAFSATALPDRIEQINNNPYLRG